MAGSRHERFHLPGLAHAICAMFHPPTSALSIAPTGTSPRRALSFPPTLWHTTYLSCLHTKPFFSSPTTPLSLSYCHCPDPPPSVQHHLPLAPAPMCPPVLPPPLSDVVIAESSGGGGVSAAGLSAAAVVRHDFSPGVSLLAWQGTLWSHASRP